MTYRLVHPASISPGPGPHPAASPYDKRITEDLGVTAFEIYQIDLPAGGETVRHDHQSDGVEDVYVIGSGTGWVIVDDEPVAVRPGHYMAVGTAPARFVRAGPGGLTFTAICGSTRLSMAGATPDSPRGGRPAS